MREHARFGSVLLGAAALSANAQEAIPVELTKVVEQATMMAKAGGGGPYKAAMLQDEALSTHTIYRPRDMEQAMNGGKLPILVWGNGACTNVGNRFRYFLTEIASRGYLVVAIGPIGPSSMEWKVDLGPPPQDLPGKPPAKSTAAQLIDGLNWAVAENGRAGSEYFNRLDTTAIAVLGQSCGGLQAIAASADPRVKTTVVLNSGTFPEASPLLPGTGDASKFSLKRLHAPTLWLSGDPSDVAHKNAKADFDAVKALPVYWLWHKGTGHAEHYRKPGGGEFVEPVVSWLNWQLKGIQQERSKFSGPDCGYCKLDDWNISEKAVN